MHVLQIVFVEGDSAEDAIFRVSEALATQSDEGSSWSDWHEIGGRWGGVFEGVPANPKALQYVENPIYAEHIIALFSKYQLGHLADCRINMVERGLNIESMIESYDPESISGTIDMGLYYAGRIIQILGREWCSDSSFLDIEAWSVSTKYFRERLETAPARQYIVPVDFHF